jgi:hypothetical protein
MFVGSCESPSLDTSRSFGAAVSHTFTGRDDSYLGLQVSRIPIQLAANAIAFLHLLLRLRSTWGLALLPIEVPAGAPIANVLGRLLRQCRRSRCVLERWRRCLMARAPRHREHHRGADQERMAFDSHDFDRPSECSGET